MLYLTARPVNRYCHVSLVLSSNQIYVKKFPQFLTNVTSLDRAKANKPRWKAFWEIEYISTHLSFVSLCLFLSLLDGQRCVPSFGAREVHSYLWMIKNVIQPLDAKGSSNISTVKGMFHFGSSDGVVWCSFTG